MYSFPKFSLFNAIFFLLLCLVYYNVNVCFSWFVISWHSLPMEAIVWPETLGQLLQCCGFESGHGCSSALIKL